MARLSDIIASDIDTVLFDLDGTLLDTAGDMGSALNDVLVNHQRKPLPLESIRPYVSKGGKALIALGFGIDASSEQADQLLPEFLEVYKNQLSRSTKLFPGMESLLTQIESSHRRWGIVTNKPGFLSEPLLHEMNLNERMGCLISGDTLATRKPCPEQLLHACEILNTDVTKAVYIGDDERDIEAGRRANMRTIAAAYGYIIADDDPNKWGADALVDHPDEIRCWLEE